MITLRDLRKAKGLSQKQVAEAIGVGRACYNQYECGHRIPDARLLRRLAETLDLTMEQAYLLLPAVHSRYQEGGHAHVQSSPAPGADGR